MNWPAGLRFYLNKSPFLVGCLYEQSFQRDSPEIALELFHIDLFIVGPLPNDTKCETYLFFPRPPLITAAHLGGLLIMGPAVHWLCFLMISVGYQTGVVGQYLLYLTYLAFDTVDHCILLEQLWGLGVRGHWVVLVHILPLKLLSVEVDGGPDVRPPAPALWGPSRINVF